MEKFKVIVDDQGKMRVYMNQIELKGVKSLEFFYEAGDAPIHKVEFYSHIAELKKI